MKVIGLFVLGLFIFALIVIGGGALFLVMINEERKNTCSKCGNYDECLHHCWAKGITTEDDETCELFNKKDV